MPYLFRVTVSKTDGSGPIAVFDVIEANADAAASFLARKIKNKVPVNGPAPLEWELDEETEFKVERLQVQLPPDEIVGVVGAVLMGTYQGTALI